MSDYFGALIRSSGIAIGGQAPARAQADPGVVESDSELEPAAMPRCVPAASTPAQAARKPTANAVERPAAPAPLTAESGVHEAPAEMESTQQAPKQAAADAAADSAARAVETPKQVPGEALVHAAMRWVAADPQPLHSAVQVAPPGGQPLPAPGEEVGAVSATQVIVERGVEAHAQPMVAMPATAAVTDIAERAPAVSQGLPIRSAWPAPDAPPAPPARSVRDEVVEISIGAIHVRVDAPAAQTVARPATPPPAAAQRATPAMSPRSALARRALRRI